MQESEQERTGATGGDGGNAPGDELVLQLNFVPAWARRPAGPDYYSGAHEGPSEERPSRDRDRNRDRDRDRGRREGRPPRPRPAGDRDRERGAPVQAMPGGRGGDERRGPSDRRGPRYEQPSEPALPVEVGFFPDRKQLSSLVRQVTASRKAYPLLDVASLFMDKAEFCSVKVEALRGTSGIEIWQCAACKQIATDRQTVETHAFQSHGDEYLVKEETEAEEPAGNFTCVGRCGLSGVLLGPPNHHSYQDKVQEMHRTRFAHLSMDAYRAKIEMVRDEAAVAQWKQESRKRTAYRLKTPTDGENGPMSWVQARDYFMSHYATKMVESSRRVVLPASVARETPDGRLLQAMRGAWDRERRFPRSLLFALRTALKHMGLYVFKAGKDITFVNHTRPVALDPDRAVDAIRGVLIYLREHPGSTRDELVRELRPGSEKDSPEAKEILSPLTWLIERGHIIEFFNGRLSVPLMDGDKRAVQPAAAELAQPAAAEWVAPTVAESLPAEPASAGSAG
jgi:hypothetical protein